MIPHTPQDTYLYYFLLRYPGRSLVFLSSIDGIRRLAPLMELLNLKAFPLHSQMEQRQRLKNLDRYFSSHTVRLVFLSNSKIAGSRPPQTLSSWRQTLLQEGLTYL